MKGFQFPKILFCYLLSGLAAGPLFATKAIFNPQTGRVQSGVGVKVSYVPRPRPLKGSCERALKTIAELQRMDGGKLTSLGKKYVRMMEENVIPGLWRQDVIANHLTDEWNKMEQLNKAPAFAFGLDLRSQIQNQLRNLRIAIEKQKGPPTWRYFSPKIAEMVAQMTSPEARQKLFERFEAKWKIADRKAFSDSFSDRVISSGVAQNRLSEAQIEAVNRYLEARPDPIGFITEINLQKRELIDHATWFPIARKLGIPEEEFSQEVVKAIPAMATWWQESPSDKALNSAITHRQTYGYVAPAPLDGLALEYLIRRALRDPEAVILPYAEASENHVWLVALPDYQVALDFREDGELDWLWTTSLPERILSRYFPATKFEEPKYEKPASVKRLDPPQAILAPKAAPVQVLPDSPLELSGASLSDNRKNRIQELHRLYPGNVQLLQEDLPLVLEVMPALSTEALWAFFEKDLILILKAQYDPASASNQLLSRAQFYESKWKSPKVIPSIRPDPKANSSVEARVVETPVSETAVLEVPAIAPRKREFVRPPEIRPEDIEYNNILRRRLKNTVIEDFNKAADDLYRLYGRKFYELEFLFRNLPAGDFKHALNLFIDWMTYKGAPLSDFGRRYPGFDELIRRDTMHTYNDFNYWKTIRYLNQQETKIGEDASGNVKLVFDSSVATVEDESLNLVASRNIFKAIYTGKIDIELSPSVVREVGHAPLSVSWDQLGNVFIPQRFAVPLSEAQIAQQRSLARAFRALGVGVVPENISSPLNSDSKILGEVALMAEGAKSEYLFVTLDANLFKPLDTLARRTQTFDFEGWHIEVTCPKLASIRGAIVPILKVKVQGPIQAEFSVSHPSWIRRGLQASP